MNQPKPTSPSVTAPLVLHRQFGAPVHVVFAAWTDPERLKRWFHPGPDWVNPAIQIDLRVGGLYRVEFLHSDSGRTEAVGGEFREIVNGQRLVYTWTWEPPKQDAGIETLVTVEFSDADGGTLINLTQERFPNDIMRQEHGEGWTGAFGCLASLFDRTHHP